MFCARLGRAVIDRANSLRFDIDIVVGRHRHSHTFVRLPLKLPRYFPKKFLISPPGRMDLRLL